MNALRFQHRCLSWIALAAILALALLPTLSHALAHARGQGAGGWAEVCTAQGPQRVAVDADGKLADTVIDGPTDAATPDADHLQHCPLCAIGSDTPPLPPAATLAPALRLSGIRVPAAFLHAPRTAHIWRSAQPRGPPAFS
jgi:hypothetical protein